MDCLMFPKAVFINRSNGQIFVFKGVKTVGDLKINQLGQDKEILEKLHQDPNNDSNNKPNGNGIRDTYNYAKPGNTQQPQSQGVNRVLFRSENEVDGRENRNNEDGWKKERSVDSADSDEGLTFDSTINNDPLLNSPLGRPLPVLDESPVSKMNQLVRNEFIRFLSILLGISVMNFLTQIK